jgi:hypothetical protein
MEYFQPDLTVANSVFNPFLLPNHSISFVEHLHLYTCVVAGCQAQNTKRMEYNSKLELLQSQACCYYSALNSHKEAMCQK